MVNIMKPFLSLILIPLIIHKCSGTSTECKKNSEEDINEKWDVKEIQYSVYTSLKSIAIRNVTAQTCVLLSYSNNLSYMFNGETGEVFVFRYEKGEGTYIPNGSSGKTWLRSKQSFDEYLKNVGPLEQLFTIGEIQGATFLIDSVGEYYITRVKKILTTVSPFYGSRCDAVGIFLHICRMTSIGLKSSLSGFYEVVSDITTEIHGDLRWIYTVFQGMGKFFSGFKQGLNVLIAKNIRLDFKFILTRKTGVDILIYFLKTLSKDFDLKNLINNTLEIDEKFFSLIDELSGGLSDDFGGLLHVIAEILKLNGKNSKENIYIAIKEYFKNVVATTSIKMSKQWLSSIQDLLKVIKKLKLEASFPNLTELLNNIIKEKWICNGINMSDVIKKILSVQHSGDDKAIKSVLDLLKKHSLSQED